MTVVRDSKCLCAIFVLSILLNNVIAINTADDGKLRVCVVEGRGLYRKSPKFCPTLEAKTNLECVEGVDQLDCVRRIHKGTADFGVLSSEDLVAARWASVEILVASELRTHDSPFEYEVVAVVDNEANINTINDLRGAKLCHPGYGLDNHWTEVLANYLESTMTAKSCDPEISLTEDRIRASAQFFGPSCKAGPWVLDPVEDRILKDRYPSLCHMCYDPYRCDVGDRFWGRRGALYCLTSGGGSVSWARLDDVRSHFGLSGLPAQAPVTEYSFLCPDGHLKPINDTNPCVWVAKPWPVVAARRNHAAQVQALVAGLSHDDYNSWEHALLSLLESYHVSIKSLDNVITIDDYLDQAVAFQSAYSFPECNPPRSIVFCTTSILEHVKCSWMQEAAQVYGVQPNVQCIRSPNLETCLDDTKYKAADVMLVDHETRLKAQRDYGLEPLLFEFSDNMHDRYVTIAVVRESSKVRTIDDLKGAKVCLPSFEGPAYLSLQETIANITQRKTSVLNYFSSKSCHWNPASSHQCSPDYRGDEGALRCLVDGVGDVAILSSDVYKRYVSGNITSPWVTNTEHKMLKLLCPYGDNERGSKFEYCYLHWTSRGHLMTHKSTPKRHSEVYNSLKEIDRRFGKKYQTDIRPFTMYGVFDKRNNVIFRDNTDTLKSVSELHQDRSKRIMEDIFARYLSDYYSDSASSALSLGLNLGIIWLSPIIGLWRLLR